MGQGITKRERRRPLERSAPSVIAKLYRTDTTPNDWALQGETRSILGLLRELEQADKSRWRLTFAGGASILIGIGELMAGPSRRRFAIKVFEALGFWPAPCPQTTWRIALLSLFERGRGR